MDDVLARRNVKGGSEQAGKVKFRKPNLFGDILCFEFLSAAGFDELPCQQQAGEHIGNRTVFVFEHPLQGIMAHAHQPQDFANDFQEQIVGGVQVWVDVAGIGKFRSGGRDGIPLVEGKSMQKLLNVIGDTEKARHVGHERRAEKQDQRLGWRHFWTDGLQVYRLAARCRRKKNILGWFDCDPRAGKRRFAQREDEQKMSHLRQFGRLAQFAAPCRIQWRQRSYYRRCGRDVL